MKFLNIKMVVVLFLIPFLLNCENDPFKESKSEKRKKSKFNQLYNLNMLDIQPILYNCPSYTLLKPGDTTVYLSEGQEFIYDITTRRVFGFGDYRINIVSSSGQTVRPGEIPNCFTKHLISQPEKPIESPTYNMYIKSISGNTVVVDYSFSYKDIVKNLASIKSFSGSGNVKITIPASRMQIPEITCHQFRLLPASDSGNKLPPIPVETLPHKW